MEDAHGSGSAAHFAETALDGVGRSDTFALLLRLVAKAGEQNVEIVAQAMNGFGIVVLEAIGEAARGRASLRRVLCCGDTMDEYLMTAMLFFRSE